MMRPQRLLLAAFLTLPVVAQVTDPPKRLELRLKTDGQVELKEGRLILPDGQAIELDHDAIILPDGVPSISEVRTIHGAATEDFVAPLASSGVCCLCMCCGEERMATRVRIVGPPSGGMGDHLVWGQAGGHVQDLRIIERSDGGRRVLVLRQGDAPMMPGDLGIQRMVGGTWTGTAPAEEEHVIVQHGSTARHRARNTDLLLFHNGDVLSGTLVGGDRTHIQFETPHGTLNVDRSAIDRIEFAAPEPPAAFEGIIVPHVQFLYEPDSSVPGVPGVFTIPAVPATPGPWLGVMVDSTSGSPVVSDVMPGSPAEKAGVAKGDVLLGLGGVAIDSYETLRSTIAGMQPGQKVDLKVRRGDTELILEAEIGQR